MSASGMNATLITVCAVMGGGLLINLFLLRDQLSAGGAGIIIPGSIVLGFLLFGTSFFLASKFMGSPDEWNNIQTQVPTIWGLTAGGSVAIFIAALLYYVQDPSKAIYFILALTCASFGLSYGAFAVAAISR